jgi:YesN/AraC family two-component response regulator
VVTLDKKSYLLRKNDLCLLKPFTLHYESCNQNQEPFEALWGLERGIKRIVLIIDRYTPEKAYTITHRTGARNIREEHKILSQVLGLYSQGRKHTPRIITLIKKLFSSYLVRLKREHRIREKNRILHQKKEREIEHMGKVITYLSDHYSEDLSIKELAADFSLSLDQFEKLYQKIHGESVKQTLIRIRIEQALTMMQDPSLSITEICEQVGYNNPLYFSRIFKNYCGYSPTAFIKKFRSS